MAYWLKDNREVFVDAEFMALEYNFHTVSHTISDEGIEVDEHGRKYARKGSFIDKDGKVTTPTVSASDLTFETDPIGILYHTVDVTHGPVDGAILIIGTVMGEYMDWGEQEYSFDLAKKLHEKLPLINVEDKSGRWIYGNFSSDGPLSTAGGGGGGGSSVSYPITVEKGGTGKTSADEALTALGGAKKTDLDSLQQKVTTLEGRVQTLEG